MEIREEVKLNQDIIKYLHKDHNIPTNIEDLSEKQKNDFLKYTRKTAHMISVIEELVSELDAVYWKIKLNCLTGEYEAEFNSFGVCIGYEKTFNGAILMLISGVIRKINSGYWQLSSFEH